MTRTQRTRDVVGSLLRAAAIGVAGGLASLVFRGASTELQNLVGIGRNILDGARSLEWWQLLTIPVCGALFAALVTRFLVRNAEGTGMTDVMEAVSVKGGPLSLRSALARALASLGIIATGGSVGREGPIITISAAASSWISRVMKAPPRERGLLLGCGVAAGFASAYHAPIAGAIFALEVVLGNFAVEFFAPVVVASVTSMLFTRYAVGGEAIYGLPSEHFHLHSVFEILPYMVLGVLAGFVGTGFQWLMARAGPWFQAVPGPRVLKMMLGGLCIGAIALQFPEVWGNGYESVTEILTREGPRFVDQPLFRLVAVMIALMGVKMVGTAITVGSGGAGGVFTPSLFIGAALGGAFGALVHEIAPHDVGPYHGYALVGMGCLVAGTTRAPIMAVLVIFEMTLTYDIVLPLLIGCVISSYVATRLYPHSIYEEKLAERGTLLPPGLEHTVLMIRKVGDVMRGDPPLTVPPAQRYDDVLPQVISKRASVVYVCDEAGELQGVIRLHDVVQLAHMGALGPGIVAADLMVPVQPVQRDQPLATVFEVFENGGLEELPVVHGEDGRTLVGVVTRRDVMATLNLEVLQRKNLRAKFVHRDDTEEQTDYVELPPGTELARVPALPDCVGKTMGEAQIRVRHGVTVVSVIRQGPEGGESRIVPTGDFLLLEGDEFVVVGAQEAITTWRERLKNDGD